MIWIAYRNELTKMAHRLAFWVSYIFFAFIALVGYLEDYLEARASPDRIFRLPDSWDQILTNDVEINFIFAGVVLVLLVANEFQWRTARQNVIDGLSKEQWFVGKLLLIPTLIGIFMATRTLVGVAFALAGTDAGDAALVTSVHAMAMGGVILAMSGALALALFVSLAVRNTGPAMAVWFFYFVALENLVAGGLVQLSDAFRPVVRFFPMALFNGAARYMQYDPEAYAAYVNRMAQNGREPLTLFDTSVLWGAASGWVAVLVLGAFLWFRRRDL
jgi:hypothetical protein